ncbi:aldo/keto reductase [Trypanosoma grayi]|uniref:aldo/keto reductase n=1 Tax=Trypanosoma grayi TaxID=71804 RepID=UPI0004F4103E|nr:aldo/keto reductase [Trypanosoma grayi]KEG05898.1 aldo/keto reductase [Trypanosoma grayi]
MQGVDEDRLIPHLETFGGVRIPHIGIGTYELRGEECRSAVACALRLGFRLVDTAASYRNEELVGAGIKDSGVPREELFVVVKIAPKAMVSEERVEDGIRQSVQKLGITYADCVLIHWPGCGGHKPEEGEENRAARRRCWKVMTSLQREGLVRHLGVSNFQPQHFTTLVEDAEVDTLFAATNQSRPTINQIELHPMCVQQVVSNYCRQHGVILQQYSPLAQGDVRLLEHPTLCAIVRDFFPGYTVPNVLLMWGLSQGFCVLVRSRSEEHLKQNWMAANAFFRNGTLSDKQIEQIRCLHKTLQVAEDLHFCWHSNRVE